MNQQEAMFYSAATSRGGRSENQDNFAVGGVVPFWTPQDPESVFGKLPADRTNYFLVADGVGGGAAGADASRLAQQKSMRIRTRRFAPARPVIADRKGKTA